MMEAFGLTQSAHSSVEGVAAEPFVFSALPTYTLYKDVQLTQSTKWVFPLIFKNPFFFSPLALTLIGIFKKNKHVNAFFLTKHVIKGVKPKM